MQAKESYEKLRTELSRVVVGQEKIARSLFIGLATGGHVLLEGVPGLAKTLSAEAFASMLSLDSVRIQFTPDLLPSDITGSETYRPQTQEFTINRGPVFSNVIVADEINRAPSKVQSALLEAMQEGKVSIAGQDLQLPDPFLVVATMNPIEEEGTYRLPEASLDRFLFKTIVEYPSAEEELQILRTLPDLRTAGLKAVFTKKDIDALRKEVAAVEADERILAYVRDVVAATRPSEGGIPEIVRYVRYGASPRASVMILKAAKAQAAISGRDYVIPEDVKSVVPDALRHRIGLGFEASIDAFSASDAVSIVLSTVTAP